MIAMVNFEQKSPTEEMDTAGIVRGLLNAQAKYAAAQNRPLGRGTHTKGVCARATFEVFDLSAKFTDQSLFKRLAQGVFAKPGTYQATIRFANAASTIYPDGKADLRALSFSWSCRRRPGAKAGFRIIHCRAIRHFRSTMRILLRF